MTRNLCISYDGVLEPLGESQVVAYLERLSPIYELTLLSFEKADDLSDTDRMSRMRARLTLSGIHWVALRYHRWPPVLSTGFDTIRGGQKRLPNAVAVVARGEPHTPAQEGPEPESLHEPVEERQPAEVSQRVPGKADSQIFGAPGHEVETSPKV